MVDTQKTEAAKVPAEDEMTQRLAKLEELLAQQQTEAQKQTRYRRLMAALMLCLVLVFAVGLFSLNRTVSAATQDLPGLIASFEDTSMQMQQVLGEVQAIDLEALDGAITGMDQGLKEIDFEALGQSIKDLQKAAEGLSNLTSIFR